MDSELLGIPTNASVLVLCLGNCYRKDDGVGWVIADRLLEKDLPGVVIRTMLGEGASLMESWEGFDQVILVDAVTSGARPGSILLLNVNEEAVPQSLFRYSTHLFGIGEAFEMARILGRLPMAIYFVGVEGREFSLGEGLSEPVEACIAEVVGQVGQLIRSLEYSSVPTDGVGHA